MDGPGKLLCRNWTCLTNMNIALEYVFRCKCTSPPRYIQHQNDIYLPVLLRWMSRHVPMCLVHWISKIYTCTLVRSTSTSVLVSTVITGPNANFGRSEDLPKCEVGPAPESRPCLQRAPASMAIHIRCVLPLMQGPAYYV